MRSKIFLPKAAPAFIFLQSQLFAGKPQPLVLSWPTHRWGHWPQLAHAVQISIHMSAFPHCMILFPQNTAGLLFSLLLPVPHHLLVLPSITSHHTRADCKTQCHFTGAEWSWALPTWKAYWGRKSLTKPLLCAKTASKTREVPTIFTTATWKSSDTAFLSIQKFCSQTTILAAHPYKGFDHTCCAMIMNFQTSANFSFTSFRHVP